MLPPGEVGQHLFGLCLAVGLAHDAPVQDDDGVGGQDETTVPRLRREAFRDGAGFGLAGGADGPDRIVRLIYGFVQVGGPDFKVQPDLLQQLPPPRRLGTKNQFHLL